MLCKVPSVFHFQAARGRNYGHGFRMMANFREGYVGFKRDE